MWTSRASKTVSCIRLKTASLTINRCKLVDNNLAKSVKNFTKLKSVKASEDGEEDLVDPKSSLAKTVYVSDKDILNDFLKEGCEGHAEPKAQD